MKKKPTKKKAVVRKKKNPQDATLRNITALKKRVTALEDTLKLVLIAMARFSSIVANTTEDAAKYKGLCK